jgi:hypothetical protein
MKPPKGTAEWHEWKRERTRVGTLRGLETKRRKQELAEQQGRLRPVDLSRFENGAVVNERLRPLVADATRESIAIAEALGGVQELTPQKIALIHDLARVGVVMRAVVELFLQSGDAELASKVGTLASVRRAHLTTLGLERFEKRLDLSRGIEVEFSTSDEAGGNGASAGAGAAVFTAMRTVAPRTNPEDQ